MDNIIVNKLGYEDETYEPIYNQPVMTNMGNGWYDRHSPSIRQQIWFETLAKYKDFKPEKPSVKYNYIPRHTDINHLIKNAKYDTVVEVKDLDTLYAAKELVDGDYKPLVLNMADWFYAGGCVGGGAKTQEEELFRRSNYCKHLLQSEYPLGVYDAIVSYDVEVYREGPDKDYALLENTWKCHMIASPALDSPQLKYRDNEYLLMSDDWDIMYNKVKQLFYYAVKEGCDSIILSAWGCGAFHLPAKEIARIFKNVLRETNGCLRKVVFAVTNHKNNYDVFKSIIAEMY
jgi:uncharacterized protein (TIGR02452 family)